MSDAPPAAVSNRDLPDGKLGRWCPLSVTPTGRIGGSRRRNPRIPQLSITASAAGSGSDVQVAPGAGTPSGWSTLTAGIYSYGYCGGISGRGGWDWGIVLSILPHTSVQLDHHRPHLITAKELMRSPVGQAGCGPAMSSRSLVGGFAGCAVGVGQYRGQAGEQDVEAGFEFGCAVVGRQGGCEAAHHGELVDR